jgi:hypothetical protein
MTPELLTVLWIAAVGSSLLFIALGGLVGLMYLLTAPWPFRRQGRRQIRRGTHRPVIAAGSPSEAEEGDRRRRAAAIAVALACSETERAPERTDWLAADSPSDWQLIHRARRLGQSRIRRQSRS